MLAAEVREMEFADPAGCPTRPQIVTSDLSSNSRMGRCRGWKIPSLFILESNVVRLSPSLEAASVGTNDHPSGGPQRLQDQGSSAIAQSAS